jgi:hypothetical protein
MLQRNKCAHGSNAPRRAAVALMPDPRGGALVMSFPSTRRFRALRLRSAVVAAVLAGLLHAPPAAAGCSSADLRLEAATPLEARLLCRAWADARAAVAPLGVRASAPLTVELAPAGGEAGMLATAFGSYDSRRHLVRLRPLAAYLAGGDGGFAQPPSVALWASYAVHEFTHALVDPHLRRTPSRRVTHEFVAYAIQLATLEPPLRARILAHYAARGYTNEQGVNLVTYGFAPHLFGVRAYLTVRAAPDPAAHLRARLHRGFPGLGDTPPGG